MRSGTESRLKGLARGLACAAAVLVAASCDSTPGTDQDPLGVSDQPPITGDGGTRSTADGPQVIGGATELSVTGEREIATGLNIPWSLAFTPDGDVLVTERDAGRILRIAPDGTATPLSGPGAQNLASANDAQGEAGLLGLALHPDDPSLLYVYQTRASGNSVLRMTLNGSSLSEPTAILEGIPKARNHDGGRLAFGPDGYLYVSTGDAGNPDLAQDKDSLAGKILRLIADGTDADGGAAPGNPFDSRVWTYGHRNVQGMAWVADGRMYASEFGQSSLDEVNLIQAGHNYGWPMVEATEGAPEGTQLGQTVDGLTYPVVEWPTHEASPSGMAATNEGLYVSALRGERLWRIPLTGEGVASPHVLIDGYGRIRNVAAGPDGGLYLLTGNTDGRGDLREGDDRLVLLTLD